MGSCPTSHGLKQHASGSGTHRRQLVYDEGGRLVARVVRVVARERCRPRSEAPRALLRLRVAALVLTLYVRDSVL